MQKKLKIIQQITRRKELSVQWIPKPFKRILTLFCSKKCKGKNILQDFNSVFKKCKTNLKTVHLNSKQKKLSTHWNAKPLEGF